MLPVACPAAGPETPARAVDRDLAALDQWYAQRLKSIDRGMKKRLSMANGRYRTQLNVLLKKKKAEGNDAYVREIEAELKRLADGKATSDPGRHADTQPEVSKAVAARLQSERKAHVLHASDTVALGDQIISALKQAELNALKEGDEKGAAGIRVRIKEVAGRAELKAARGRAEGFRNEAEQRQKEARRKKFLEDLAAGRLGPFAHRSPNAAWRPRLTLGKAWSRMQALDCDYSVFEYFSGRSVTQLMPDVSRKPDREIVRYLLYMLFNGLDSKNAVTRLKSFPIELVMENIRSSFWPEQLHALKPDGAYFWAAWTSYVKDDRAHGILQLTVKRQKDKSKIHDIHSFRSAPVPKKGWQSVSASSYFSEQGAGP